MSLSRPEIEAIQDEAAAGTLQVAGVAPAQLVFLTQMALEGDDNAWQAIEVLRATGSC